MSIVFKTAATTQPGSVTPVSFTEAMRIDANGSIGLGTAHSAWNTVTAPGGVISNAGSIDMADLKSEVFDAKIDDLINLWLTRYGNEWVDLVDIEADEFYLRVYKRLRSVGQLEQHYLTDRSRFVCRKPE